MNRFESSRPGSHDIAWCPGCGNFLLRKILIEAFTELGLESNKVVIVSGIGQAAKMPHYLNVNGFHSLHGRAIPIATGVKIANPELTVIAEGGDGDMFAEGGNHFIHGIRRNADITVIIHNNQIYGLTKGQASPTTMIGMKTPIQKMGVFEEPFNPEAVAISLDASFVARGFVGDNEKTKEIIKEAILHKGFSVVNIFQNCVTFNKINTFKWYRENTYWIENHNCKDKVEALKKAFEKEPYPLGIFYKTDKKDFNENVKIGLPLYKNYPSKNNIEKIFERFF